MLVTEYLENGYHKIKYELDSKKIVVTEINKDRYWSTRFTDQFSKLRYREEYKNFDNKEQLENYINEKMRVDKWKSI